MRAPPPQNATKSEGIFPYPEGMVRCLPICLFQIGQKPSDCAMTFELEPVVLKHMETFPLGGEVVLAAWSRTLLGLMEVTLPNARR